MLDSIGMKPKFFLLCSFLSAGSLPAQTPAATPPVAEPQFLAHASSIGIRYSLPSDWEVLNSNPTLPDVQKQVEKGATSDAEKRGIGCVQMALTARHGNPPSVVSIVALPFDCFGEQMTEKDLPGFAQGAMEGVNNSFDVSARVSATCSLGTHSLWIARSNATVKGHAERPYTVETVCTILMNAAVCWMAMAADKEALATFENGAVTLDGDAQPALVPATAFAKPSP